MQLQRIFQAIFLSFFLFLLIPSTSVQAANIQANDNLNLTGSEELNNPYLFGDKISVTSPVRNDLVTAGGNIMLESSVSGSIWAAGGDIEIASSVGNSVRVAGGTITISAPITEDLFVFGGDINLTKEASIGADLFVFGGQMNIDSPVGGNVRVYGGDVTINSTVGGNVDGEMGTLTLGENAQIAGNLSYTAENRQNVSEDKVGGIINYTETKHGDNAGEGAAGLVTAGSLYMLATDIIFVLIVLWLLRPLVTRTLTTINSLPLKSAGVGFVTLLLTPLAALILLAAVWVGIGMFFVYALLLILSMAILKLFVGWKIMSWFEGRNKKNYVLDWKEALLGVFLVFILGLIPVLGWLAVFILFLMGLGGLTLELFTHLSAHKEVKKTHVTKAKK